ncbi:MAG: hypothetical protein PVI03_03960, partial [Candidatus Thorarchaeota archaeon]
SFMRPNQRRKSGGGCPSSAFEHHGPAPLYLLLVPKLLEDAGMILAIAHIVPTRGICEVGISLA